MLLRAHRAFLCQRRAFQLPGYDFRLILLGFTPSDAQEAGAGADELRREGQQKRTAASPWTDHVLSTEGLKRVSAEHMLCALAAGICFAVLDPRAVTL